MGSDNTTAIIIDTTFVALQKCRIFPANLMPLPSKQSYLAVSSKYQITFAVSDTNTILTWNSSAIHQLRRTNENANVEYTQLRTRTTKVLAGDAITTIAVNSDGSLLATLANNISGTFVRVYDVTAFSTQFNNEVYPLCSIKVGQNSNSCGVCLEWNPAASDTLAASASDNSLVVAKINIISPSGYTLIGNATLGATANCISWSPKGKQLVVGDSVGKISQLKPELEVVRATLHPVEVTKQTDGQVCGICWLSTTEWFITYAFPEVTDIHAYLLTLKKDKPASWVLLPDVSYCNASSSLNHRVLCDTTLLVAWNVVFITCSKSSELFVLGKVGESWKIWSLDEDSRVDLPTAANREDSFPLGMAVDLSSNTEVALSADGTRRHQPSPIIMILTNDGVIVSYNTVSMNPAHAPCQIQSSPIDPSQIKFGLKPETAPVAQAIIAPETATPRTPTTAFFSESILDVTPVPKHSSTPQQLFAKPASATPVSAPPQLFTNAPGSAMAASTPQSLFSKTPLSATKDVSVMVTTGTTTPATDADNGAKLNNLRVEFNAALKEPQSEFGLLISGMKALHIGLQKTTPQLKEYETTKNDSAIIVLRELSKLSEFLDIYCENVEEKLRTGVVRGADALEVITNCEEDLSSFLNDHDDFDRNERMIRVVKAMDYLKEHFASGKDMLDTLKKSSERKSVSLSSWVIWHNKDVRQVIKVITNSLKSIRCRIDSLEDDSLRIQQAKKKMVIPPKIRDHDDEHVPIKVNILKLQKVPSPTGDITAMRRKLRELLKAKDIDPPKVRNMVSLPFFAEPKQPLPDQTQANHLLKEVINKLASPRLISKPIRCASDAATQADVPPAPQPKHLPIPNEVKRNTHLDLDRSVSFSSYKVPESLSLTEEREPLKFTNAANPKNNENIESPTLYQLLDQKETSEPIHDPRIIEKEKSSSEIFKLLEEEEPTQSAESTIAPSTAVSSTFPSTTFSLNSPISAPNTSSVITTTSDSKPSPLAAAGSTSAFTVSGSNPTTASTSSIFAAKSASEPSTTASPFGSFGAPKVTTTVQDVAPVSSSPAFSFKQATTISQTAPASFSFAPKPSTTTAISGFAAAAAKAATEDGMMEDEAMGGGGSQTTQPSSSVFGGGFMSGLGNSSSANSGTKSIFGGVTSNTQQSQGSSLFSFNGSQNRTQGAASGFSSFGSSTQRSSFGAAAQQAAAEQPAATTSVFGGSAKFGASPAFGAKASFGSPATFGAGVQQKTSVFGGGGSGFAAFAGKSNQPGASIFGSGASQHAVTSSIFGGGSNQSSNTSAPANKSSFNTWR